MPGHRPPCPSRSLPEQHRPVVGSRIACDEGPWPARLKPSLRAPAAAPDRSRPRISRRRRSANDHLAEHDERSTGQSDPLTSQIVPLDQFRSGSPHPPGRKHPPPGRCGHAASIPWRLHPPRIDLVTRASPTDRELVPRPDHPQLHIRPVHPSWHQKHHGVVPLRPEETCSSVLSSSIRRPPDAKTASGVSITPGCHDAQGGECFAEGQGPI